jgi:S-adenosylmethionine synthetase
MFNKKVLQMVKKTITSEFVSYGHPDKIADQIADAILDEFLKKDKNVRAGIEVLLKDNIVVLGGEISSTSSIDYDKVVRSVYKDIHFSVEHHLSSDDIKVINLIGKQSQEIHNGVDKNDGSIGAGDQGFMIGFASNETPVYMPLGIYVAKSICQYVANGHWDEERQMLLCFGPDTKSQVIVDYDENGNASISSILVSTMSELPLEETRNTIKDIILNNAMEMDDNIFRQYIKSKDIKIDINPCGSWKIGGPVSDCGVTGRKLVVDQYGGYSNIGGGNLSGKDMTKVDKSAAYMARYLAKNIVASGICDAARVELSYMIGVPEPSSINIEMNRNQEKEGVIKSWIKNNIDLTPKGIIKRFDGSYPRNYHLSKYGHFGVDVNKYRTSQERYPWEKLDICDSLREELRK